MKNTKWVIVIFGFSALITAIIRYLGAMAAPTYQMVDPTIYLPIIIKQELPTPTPTPTTTPSPTSTPIPTLTPIPPEVIVVSSNAFMPYEDFSDLLIVGEILNNTGSNVGSIQISGTLRDTNGNVVDSDYTFSDIDVLTPGMKSPFSIFFLDPPSWATYDLFVTWDTTSDQPHSLEILNHTSYFDSYDAYHVVGEIRNQYAENRTYIEAYVTLYDVNGKVIGVDSSYTNPHDLAHGQTASFDTEIYFWKGKPDRNQVATYSLQVIGE
jgi:hypothetical protein